MLALVKKYSWIVVAILACSPLYGAAAPISFAGIDIGVSDGAQGNEEVATAIQILALLTVLSLAPAIMVMVTSFTRIIVVLAMLRHAFGMPSIPPNTVIISLALFLTLFSMMPVFDQIDEQALQPYRDGDMTSRVAVEKAMIPMREFMIRQTREKDIALLLDIANKPIPDRVEDIETTTLIPAFMLSELQSAFQIGFVLFLPFLAIDLITASVLMAMGMIMVPPMTISMPLKILMFVLIDGWALVVGALMGSFN